MHSAVYNTERHDPVIDAFLALAHAIITLRRLLRRAWTLYPWDTRPARRPDPTGPRIRRAGERKAATMRRMVGFRVLLPDTSVLNVRDAAEYVVTNDGALVLRTGGNDLLRVPADGWLEVGALAAGPPPNVASLLDESCVDLGFCLPPEARVRLQGAPPGDVDAFTDAVFVAEGLDPRLDKRLRRHVRERVVRHFGANAP
jgi:hypothetical protein